MSFVNLFTPDTKEREEDQIHGIIALCVRLQFAGQI